jgi:hypothetical protein
MNKINCLVKERKYPSSELAETFGLLMDFPSLFST